MMPSSNHLAIHGLIERYFSAIDRSDPEALASCFTSTCEYRSGSGAGEVFASGRSEIVERLSAAQSGFVASSHALSNTSITVEGGSALGDTFAVIHCLLPPRDESEGTGRMRVRGIRYRDRYVFQQDRWQIDDRHHMPLWQYGCPAVPPSPPERG